MAERPRAASIRWESTMNHRTGGVVMVLVASACFGTLAIFGKFAADAGLNTTTLLTYRFVIGTALLWAGLALWGRAILLDGRHLGIALALGVLYAAFSGLFFWGLLFVPAGVAGITFYTFPIIVYVLSVRVLGERVTRRKLLALAIAIGGIMLIVAGNTADVNVVGVALVFLAACGYAIYITGSRAALASIPPDLLAGTALVATAVSFLVFGGLSGRLFVPGGTEQWGIILGIAVLGTAIPLLLYVSGLQRVEASHAAIISTSEPVVTVILGVLILGEVLTVPIVLGGALVIVAVLLIQTDVAAVRTAQDVSAGD